jgi:HK97 family phage prohead protease
MKTSISLAEFHAKAGAGKRPRGKVLAEFKLAPNMDASLDTEERSVAFIFSDDSVDAYGDTIDARGWVYDRSGAGTVALYGHDPSGVENVIGRAHNVRVEGNRLLGDIHFATKDVNPNAEVVYQLVKGGYINSVSVGFQPMEWTLAKDKQRPGGIDFKKQKLLEISVVAIPANENAVAQARAAGIDVDRVGLKRAEMRVTKRGLYSVAALAGILADLGWLEDTVAWEADYEGDDSDVPARLLDALQTLGQILVDMTVEEVGELLADDDGVIDGLVSLEAPTDAQRAFVALAKFTRAGRVLSQANETKIRDASAAATSVVEALKVVLDGIEPEEEKAAPVTDNDHGARLRELNILAVPRH